MLVPGLVSCSCDMSGRRFGAAGRRRLLGQAEVQDLDLSRLGDKDIGRLDVAMDDSFGMSGVQAVGDLDGNIQRFINLHRVDC